MRALYCAAGLLLSFACARGEEIPTPQTLAILFKFQQPYPDRALAEAQRELNALTSGSDIRLEWYDRTSPQAKLSFPSILVLDFLGRCDPGSENKVTEPSEGWLARMHVSDGVVLPFGEVNCDLVRTLLNDGTQGGVSTDQAFGRALARVLAHELYHFITNTTEHFARGLTKPSFSRNDLLRNSLKLDRREIDRLAKTALQ